MDKKNHDIEVLRTLAIVFVILAHIPGILAPDSFYFKVISVSKFGSGVDLFFCVSGFLITKGLLDKKLNELDFDSFKCEARQFYIKRIWRLMPAAMFWIIVSIILSFALEKYHAFLTPSDMLKSAFFSITQTQNIYFPICRQEGTCGNLGIYWSLSLENQFYLLLPLILFSMNNKKLCFFMLTVFLIQFFIPRTLNSQTPLAWPVRTDAIALGVIIAVLSHKNINYFIRDYIPNRTWVAVLTFISLTFFLAFFTNPNPLVFYQTGLTALLSGIFVLLASLNVNFFARGVFIRTICDYIGSRSYSLYLTHFIVLVLVGRFFLYGVKSTTWLESVAHVALFLFGSFLLAELSYRFIENKFRYNWVSSHKK
ncbi:acyltransferase [Pantoea agglomerans]|uniref:acyltransferase family protein n=1 Tax=Enterobacter agglomerans TaxID=549 RepID=UPI000B3421E4|nr:acyltransferase [Pantoea agglomerans]PHP91712.1 acyltransferase [Pantoea agglomerans]